jgi:hypothetical protein
MSKRLHIPTALATVVVALAAGPAVASAAAPVHLVSYRVDIDATITHKHVQSYSTSYESGDRTVDTSSKLHAELPQVTFKTGDRIELYSMGEGDASAVTTGKTTAHYRNTATNQSQTCTPVGSEDPWGKASIVQDLVTPLTGDESVDVRLGDDPRIGWNCTDPDIGARPEYDLSQNTEDVGGGSLDANFLVPKEAVGFGKIIQNISGPPAETATFCPGKNEGNTRECTYGWTGTVTFTKTSETTITEANPPSEADLATGAVQTSAAKGKGVAAPTAPGTASADAKGSTVSFTAACPAGCSGTAALTVPHAGASAAKARPLATLRFTVKAGTHKVRLRVPKKAARALRRARGGRLAITLKARGGTATHRTLKVRVARR